MRTLLLILIFSFATSFAQDARKDENNLLQNDTLTQSVDAGIHPQKKEFRFKWLLVPAAVASTWSFISFMVLTAYDEDARTAMENSYYRDISQEYYQDRLHKIDDLQKKRDTWRANFFVSGALALLTMVPFICFNF